MFISKVKMQALILALSAWPVFKIKIEFSAKALIQRLSTLAPGSPRGAANCYGGVGAKLHEFCISCIEGHRRCDLSGLEGTVLH